MSALTDGPAQEPEILELTDPARPDWRDAGKPRPVRVALWRPATPTGRDPVRTVLISHGTGGAARQMAWLAEPLAAAGFLAASVDHHGNNFVDGYLPQGFAFEWERARDLSFALTALAEHESLGKVGAAGFSSGGYTAAALVGARISSEVFEAVVRKQIEVPEIPEFPGLVDKLHAAVTEEGLTRALSEAGGDYSDPRVSAAFLICPAIGEFIAPASLGRVAASVRILWGDADVSTPPETNALVYLGAIRGATGESAGQDVEHYHFLGSNPDGASARERVAADAVEFFGKALS